MRGVLEVIVELDGYAVRGQAMKGQDRRNNLTTTFRDDEVRLMANLCRALLTDGELTVLVDSPERAALARVAAKFARLHARLSTGGGAW